MSEKIRDNNYVQIAGWMVNELGLKGNELLIYAIIYGFSQDGETRFTGSLKYLCAWTKATKPSVIKHLKSLVDKGYVKKEDKYINGVKFCEYYVPVDPESGKLILPGYEKNLTGVVKNFNRGGKEILPGVVKNFNRGGKEILPNNTIYNTNDNTKDNNKDKGFRAPTVQEVKAYCQERNNNIDPEYFVSYYEARGWELSKGRKVKDWKACVRTWERRNFEEKENRRPQIVKNDEKPATMEELKAIAMGYVKR